jgi:hypothetical protein
VSCCCCEDSKRGSRVVVGRVEIFKIFFSFFNFQQHKTIRLRFAHTVQYILSVWKNQMSNNVNSDFNLIDFRTSRVPNLLN